METNAMLQVCLQNGPTIWLTIFLCLPLRKPMSMCLKEEGREGCHA